MCVLLVRVLFAEVAEKGVFDAGLRVLRNVNDHVSPRRCVACLSGGGAESGKGRAGLGDVVDLRGVYLRGA